MCDGGGTLVNYFPPEFLGHVHVTRTGTESFLDFYQLCILNVNQVDYDCNDVPIGDINFSCGSG